MSDLSAVDRALLERVYRAAEAYADARAELMGAVLDVRDAVRGPEPRRPIFIGEPDPE